MLGVNSSKGSTPWLPVLGWSAGALFFFYAWIQRVAPSVIIEELMLEFTVTAAVLGNLSAVYFYGYAGMQIPVGLLLDRFGTRRLLTFSALLCALGSLIFALGSTLEMVMVGRFIVGASAAFALVGTMSVAAHWFAPTQFALLSGLAMASGMAGGMFGQAPVRLGVEASDWRTALVMIAAFGVLVAGLLWATVRDKPTTASKPGRMSVALKTVGRHPQTWLIALAGLGATAPLLGFAGLWGIPFIEVATGVSRLTAATLASLLIAGWGIGAPLWGWVSDRLRRRRLPLLIGFTLQTLSLGIVVLWPGLTAWQMGVMCFAVGLFGSSQITCFALIRETHSTHVVSTALGVVNASVTAAGALFQPVIGYLLDWRWLGEISNGVRYYGVENYRYSLVVLVASCAMALICALFIKETAGLQYKDEN